MLPVVNEDGEGDNEDDEDTDGDDDGGQVVNEQSGVRHGRERRQGVGQAAAVTRLQDVLANDVGVVHVARQLAAVHHSGLVVAHPGSENRIINVRL